MDRDYYDSAVGIEISRSRAVRELRRHGVTDPTEFFDEIGDFATYLATTVLDWLGY